MKTFNDVNELNKYLRNILITQTQLDGSRVLNALSLYGTELDKLLSDSTTQYDAIDNTNTTLLFELQARSSTSDMSMEENETSVASLVCSDNVECDSLTVSDNGPVLDTSIAYYKSYKLNIIIYGNASSTLAGKLVARLRTETVRNKLYCDGIYLESVSDQTTINEYKNESMWLRNDITVNISVKQDIAQISVDGNFNNFDMTILNK